MPFALGIDSSTGDYGYIKVGADSVTPFKGEALFFTSTCRIYYSTGGKIPQITLPFYGTPSQTNNPSGNASITFPTNNKVLVQVSITNSVGQSQLYINLRKDSTTVETKYISSGSIELEGQNVNNILASLQSMPNTGVYKDFAVNAYII